jgi:hypothetical protein
MAENKKSVLLYCDIIHTVKELSDDEAGRLFKHYLAYINDLNPTPPDKLTQIVFEPIKQNLKRDLVKWQSISEKRSESGRLAGIKSGEARRTKTNQNEPNVQFANETNQNEHVTVKDKVTVTDTVIVNDKDILLKKETKKRVTELIFPFDSIRFINIWNLIVDEPKWKKKTKTALQSILKKLSEYDEATACEMLETSLQNGWQGVFELKNNQSNKNTTENLINSNFKPRFTE